MAKKIYTMQQILMDHEHYSRLERVYALFSIDLASETVIKSGNPFLHFIWTDDGEDIHESLGSEISTFFDKTAAMAKLKAMHPEIPDKDLPYHADKAMDFAQERMRISAIKFDLLVRAGKLKPSIN